MAVMCRSKEYLSFEFLPTEESLTIDNIIISMCHSSSAMFYFQRYIVLQLEFSNFIIAVSFQVVGRY